MTAELIAFVRARLAEREAKAKAAQPEGWYAYFRTVLGDHEMTIDGAAPEHPEDVAQVFTKADARHIAANDPAWVLADVAAKRALIDEVLRHYALIDGEFGAYPCRHEPDEIAAGACPSFPPNEIPALRLLALPDASHPDYQETWKP